MKSFTVSVEARVVIMAETEREAAVIARQLVQENDALLITSSVSAGYPSAWEPKKGPWLDDRTATASTLKTPEPQIDDEVPF